MRIRSKPLSNCVYEETLSGWGGKEVLPYLYINVTVVATPERSAYNVLVAFKQVVTVNTNGVQCFATTYSVSSTGFGPPSLLREQASEVLEELVDRFSNDYLAANEKVEAEAGR